MNKREQKLQIYSRCAQELWNVNQLDHLSIIKIDREEKSVKVFIENILVDNNGKRAEHKWTTVTKQSLRC